MPDIPKHEILDIAKSKKLATRLVVFAAFIEDRDLMIPAAAGTCDVISKDAKPGDLVQTLRQIANGPRPQLIRPLAERQAQYRIKP